MFGPHVIPNYWVIDMGPTFWAEGPSKTSTGSRMKSIMHIPGFIDLNVFNFEDNPHTFFNLEC